MQLDSVPITDNYSDANSCYIFELGEISEYHQVV